MNMEIDYVQLKKKLSELEVNESHSEVSEGGIFESSKSFAVERSSGINYCLTEYYNSGSIDEIIKKLKQSNAFNKQPKSISVKAESKDEHVTQLQACATKLKAVLLDVTMYDQDNTDSVETLVDVIAELNYLAGQLK